MSKGSHSFIGRVWLIRVKNICIRLKNYFFDMNYLSTKPVNAYVCSVLKTLMFLCTQWLWFSEKVVVFCILRGKSCCFFVQFLSKKATLILRIGFQKQKQKYAHRDIWNESYKCLEILKLLFEQGLRISMTASLVHNSESISLILYCKP